MDAAMAVDQHTCMLLYVQYRVGVGNISLLSYIVILRAHDNHIVVVLKLSSYRVHIISGVVFAEIRHAVAK